MLLTSGALFAFLRNGQAIIRRTINRSWGKPQSWECSGQAWGYLNALYRLESRRFFPLKMVSMNDFKRNTQCQNGVQHFNGFPAALFTFRCCVVTNRVWCFWLSQPAGHKSGKVRKSGKSRSRSRGSSRSPSRKGGKKSGKKSRSPSPTKTKREVDLLSPDAMSNGYYISHNVPQFLEFRGFGWDTGGAKGKKKKKGKGKKKK